MHFGCHCGYLVALNDVAHVFRHKAKLHSALEDLMPFHENCM